MNVLMTSNASSEGEAFRACSLKEPDGAEELRGMSRRGRRSLSSLLIKGTGWGSEGRL